MGELENIPIDDSSSRLEGLRLGSCRHIANAGRPRPFGFPGHRATHRPACPPTPRIPPTSHKHHERQS